MNSIKETVTLSSLAQAGAAMSGEEPSYTLQGTELNAPLIPSAEGKPAVLMHRKPSHIHTAASAA